MPVILGPIMTSDGQPLIPAFKVKPWDKISDMGPNPGLQQAQHLLDGGQFKFNGDLNWLGNEMEVPE